MNRAPALYSVAILAAWLTGSVSVGQDVNRSRVETEAAGQAAEADRLYKAGKFAEALPLYEAEQMSRHALGDLRYEAYAWRGVGCCRVETWRRRIRHHRLDPRPGDRHDVGRIAAMRGTMTS